MDFFTTLLLSLLGGALSVFSPCSLVIVPALAINRCIERERVLFFGTGVALGTLIFIVAASIVQGVASHSLLHVMGVVMLALGSFQLFRAYRNKDCSVCCFSVTEKMSTASLGFLASGFYGCAIAPIAAVLAYSVSDGASTWFIVIFSVAYLIGRMTCMSIVFFLPVSFYVRRFVNGQTAERALNITTGLVILGVGLYLTLIQ